MCEKIEVRGREDKMKQAVTENITARMELMCNTVTETEHSAHLKVCIG
jgi:hypothetical protein